jgi:hypothetical protein
VDTLGHMDRVIPVVKAKRVHVKQAKKVFVVRRSDRLNKKRNS